MKSKRETEVYYPVSYFQGGQWFAHLGPSPTYRFERLQDATRVAAKLRETYRKVMVERVTTITETIACE